MSVSEYSNSIAGVRRVRALLSKLSTRLLPHVREICGVTHVDYPNVIWLCFFEPSTLVSFERDLVLREAQTLSPPASSYISKCERILGQPHVFLAPLHSCACFEKHTGSVYIQCVSSLLALRVHWNREVVDFWSFGHGDCYPTLPNSEHRNR